MTSRGALSSTKSRTFMPAFIITFVLVVSGIAMIAGVSYAFTSGQSASLVIGQSDFVSGGSTTSATGMWGPRSLAFDSSGNLWVADSSNNRVTEYLKGNGFASGQSASIVLGQSQYTTGNSGNTANGLTKPAGLAFDSFGNLWVADSGNNRILEFSAPFATAESASLVLGQPDLSHNVPATTAAGLSSPQGISFDSSGNLWVADQSNNRILKYQAPFTTGETASLVIGQSDFTHGSATTTTTGLQNPAGLAFDSSGNLWVADQGYNRVLEYTSPLASGQTASLVIGQFGFTTSSSGVSPSSVQSPARIAFDSSGGLWVADSGNCRVIQFSPPLATGESASRVIGQPDLFTQGPATTASGLQSPTGIAFDSSGNLWVADTGNSRVLEFLASPTTTSTTQSTTITTSTTTTTITVTASVTATTTATVSSTIATTVTVSSTYITATTITSTVTTVATSTATVTTSQTSTVTTTSTATTTQTISTTATTTQTINVTSSYHTSTAAGSTSTSANTSSSTGGASSTSLQCVGSVCFDVSGAGLNWEAVIALLAVVGLAFVLVLFAVARRARRPTKSKPERPSPWV